MPTPTPHDGSSNGISAVSRQGGPSLLDRLRLLPTPTAADSRSAAIQTVLNPRRPTRPGCVTLTDSVRLLPTPRATDTGTAGRRAGKGFRPPLSQQVIPLVDPQALPPTPRATDGTKGCPGQRGSKGDLMLPSAVIRLLTPSVDDTGGDGSS
jgi:DNA (cytosine-5)-methyltransferase 1